MRSLLTRSVEAEKMDGRDLRLELLGPALTRVAGVTRRFGGFSAIRAAVRQRPGCSVLDVGTGNLFLPRALRRDLGSRLGTVVGVDNHPDVVRVAAGTTRPADGVSLVRADGCALPFEDDSFDVVVSTLTLHHLRAREATTMLAEMGRVAARRVLMWDLERSLHGWAGAKFLSWTLWRNDPLVRYDGPLSVRRAYRKPELVEMARQAGLRDIAVRRRIGHVLLNARPPVPRDRQPEIPIGDAGATTSAGAARV